MLLAASPLHAVAAERLLTDAYDVTIVVRCEEGVVACKNVQYTGVHRKSGKSIKLSGEAIHTRCADGVTPCRFLGYMFKNGDTVYMVTENGNLSVEQGGKVVLQEQGTWQ